MRYSLDTYAEVNYQFDDELFTLANNANIEKKVVKRLSNFDDIDKELRKATEDILKIEKKEVT